MTWAVDDVITIKLHQFYLGQEVINKLTYNIVDFGVSADIDTLLEILESVLIDVFIPLQVSSLLHYKQRIDNLTDTISFVEQLTAISGTALGESTSSFVAAAFKKVVATKITRPGSMRMAGVSENAMSGNTWAPGVTEKANLETVLGANITNELSPPENITIAPIIARFSVAGPPDIYLINPVTSVAASPNLTSQVSRKINVGI